MTLREALSQQTYPEGQLANGWYFSADGRIYCVIYADSVIYASEAEWLAEIETKVYFLYDYPPDFQPSKFREMRKQLGTQQFQTFEELENAVLLEHALRVDEGWYPNRNPFGE